MESTQPSVLPGDFIDEEFEIEKENWNIYELKDDIKIKGRIILLRLTRNKNAQAGQYNAQTQNIFVVFAPNDRLGPPSTPLPPDKIPPEKMIPQEIINSNEVWNTYKIVRSGERIRIKLVVTDIFRVKDEYDQLGEPYYIIRSGVIISPAPKDIPA